MLCLDAKERQGFLSLFLYNLHLEDGSCSGFLTEMGGKMGKERCQWQIHQQQAWGQVLNREAVEQLPSTARELSLHQGHKNNKHRDQGKAEHGRGRKTCWSGKINGAAAGIAGEGAQMDTGEVSQGGSEILLHLHQLWTSPDFAQLLWLCKPPPLRINLNSPVTCHCAQRGFPPHPFPSRKLGR